MKKKLTLEQLKSKLNVTKDGVITRLYDDHIYTVSDNNYGYLISAGEYIHRLVAMFHIPNPDNLPCVNHKDGNKKNNHVDNLEWCSYSHNGKHAVTTGLQPVAKGCNHYSSKLTTEQVQAIIDGFVAGKSYPELEKEFSISNAAVSRIIRGVRYKEENVDRSKVKKRSSDILSQLSDLDINQLWVSHNHNISSIARELNIERKAVSKFFNSKGYIGTSGAPIKSSN